MTPEEIQKVLVGIRTAYRDQHAMFKGHKSSVTNWAQEILIDNKLFMSNLIWADFHQIVEDSIGRPHDIRIANCYIHGWQDTPLLKEIFCRLATPPAAKKLSEWM